jgi:hypothetical protein
MLNFVEHNNLIKSRQMISYMTTSEVNSVSSQ